MSIADTVVFSRQAMLPHMPLDCSVWRTPDNATQSYESGFGDIDVVDNPPIGVTLDSHGRAKKGDYKCRVVTPKANRASEETVSDNVDLSKVRVVITMTYNTTLRHADTIKVVYPTGYFDDFPSGVTKEYEVVVYSPQVNAITCHAECEEIGVVEGE